MTNILVVDDEENIRTSLSDILDDEGYKVVAVGTGSEALENIKKGTFDVVVTDLMLPDINGLELLEELKKVDAKVCVIMITAYGTVKTAVEAIRKGAYDYITKPFRPEEILILIKKGLMRERLSLESYQLREAIVTFAAAIDAKDPYTRGHSEQVTEYAVAIAKELGLSTEQIDNIREAGFLHDIGKIGISEDILLKPDRLTEEEFAEIKNHPKISREILGSIVSLSPILPLVYHHHERYDGKGYPDGIKGENIPLGARILAVADSYQAMTSSRPYRKALSEEVAIEQLKINSGTQFDPQVVDVFLRVLDKREAKP